MKFTTNNLKYLTCFIPLTPIDSVISIEEKIRNKIRREIFLRMSQEPFENVLIGYEHTNPLVYNNLLVRKKLVFFLRKVVISTNFHSEKEKFKKIKKLRRILEKRYFSSIIDPGEMVGVIGGTSIGQQTTQTVLNSFHFCGSSSATVTQGLPRLMQLLDLTVKQKSSNMSFFLNPKLFRIDDKGFNKKVYRFCRNIEELYIDNITLPNIDVGDDFILPRSERNDDFYKDFFTLFPTIEHKIITMWSIRFRFDRNKLFIYDLELSFIARLIERVIGEVLEETNINEKCYCVYSTNEEGIIDVYLDVDKTTTINDFSSSKKSTTRSKKTQNPENFLKNQERHRFQDVIFPIINDIQINGIKNIKSSFMKINNSKIVTEGNNVTSIISLLNENGENYIDPKTLTSSNPWDIYNMFGIEALRQYLKNELTSALSFGNNFMHECHIDLLVDGMTRDGYPKPVNRYGCSKTNGTFARVSFEEQFKNFTKAAFLREVDPLKNVSSTIPFNPKVNGQLFDILYSTKVC